MEMSDLIKSERTRLDMTQQDLADRLGLKKSAIAKYENGRVENLKRSTIEKMAKIFNCSPAYLMGWTDNVKPMKTLSQESFIVVGRLQHDKEINYNEFNNLRVRYQISMH